MKSRRSMGLAAAMGWLVGCAGALQEPVSPRAISRGTAAPPLITEVAQATEHAGSNADKVEVYCSAAHGCDAFKVCDTAAGGGTTCSALASALEPGARVVVSRGASITDTDAVWLADASGNELPGTRVGPIACAPASSSARRDCPTALFEPCGSPSLGLSSGACDEPGFGFQYSLGFAQNQHGQPETTCTRGLCQQLLAAIQTATRSVDFAVYGVRGQPDIIAALVAAQARGVRVRGVVDSENADCTAFGYPDTPLLMRQLAPGSVVCDVGVGHGYIMHDKFFVFDAARVWTGSTNISDTELGGEYSSDVAALIGSPELASIYGRELEEMFAGHFHKRKTDDTPHVLPALADGTVIESYFSPSDHAIAHAVLPLIASATQSLDIAMFFFTDASIADALVAAHARGVHVRMVLDASGASNQFSKHPQLCAAGIEVKIETWGGKSHSKWAVADAALPESAAVLFGSMNWTGSGDTQNDENTLVVRNAGFAAKFHAELERQWTDLALQPVCERVDVESAQSSVCAAPNDCSRGCSSGACCDGLDNDRDGRTDLQEEACACADGIDNDGDGFVDTADFDCRVLPDDP